MPIDFTNRKRATVTAAVVEPQGITRIPYAGIVTHPDLQMRVNGLDHDHVAELVDILSDDPSLDLDPVEIVEVNGVRYLAHGYHRHAAYGRVDRDEMPATFRVGTWDEAFALALAANNKSSLRLTDEDKRNKVRKAFEVYTFALSDTEIARRCAVTARFVGTMRKRITEERTAAGNPVPVVTSRKVTRNGKTYTIQTDNIGPKPKPAPKTKPKGRNEIVWRLSRGQAQTLWRLLSEFDDDEASTLAETLDRLLGG